MLTTLTAGFDKFLTRLTPTGGETEAAKNHRASIEACLTSKLGMLRFFRTGSFGNGTSISGYSDVDYFASLPSEHISSYSELTLIKLKSVLDTRFPQTGVHIDSPAVVVPFGSIRSETTEIVPSTFFQNTPRVLIFTGYRMVMAAGYTRALKFTTSTCLTLIHA